MENSLKKIESNRMERHPIVIVIIACLPHHMTLMFEVLNVESSRLSYDASRVHFF
jgi:hypothetical protein